MLDFKSKILSQKTLRLDDMSSRSIFLRPANNRYVPLRRSKNS
jgi:hypothetical protein